MHYWFPDSFVIDLILDIVMRLTWFAFGWWACKRWMEAHRT